MITVPLRDVGKQGQISDIPPFNLPPGVLTSSSNVVSDFGGVSKAPGMTLRFDLNDSTINPDGYPTHPTTPAGDPVWFENFFVDESGKMVILSEDSPGTPGSGRFFSLKTDGTFEEVTGGAAAAVSNINDWDSCSFNEYSIWTAFDTEPFYIGNGAAVMTTLPGWPDNDPGFSATWTAQMIRPYKNFLIALKMVKDGVELDNRIQWSDAADATGLPPNWNETDPTSLAGGAYLSGEAGIIVDGLELNDSFMIYTTEGIWELRLVGGAYTMQLRKVGHRGVLNKNCIVAFDNFHFVICDGIFYVFDGRRVNVVGHHKISETFFQRLARSDRLHCSHNRAQRIITIHFQDDVDAEYANKYIQWHYEEDTWTTGEVDDFPTVRAQLGPTSTLDVTWENIEDGSPDIGQSLPPGVRWRDVDLGWSELEEPSGGSKYHWLSRTNKVFQWGGTFLRDGENYDARCQQVFLDIGRILGDKDGMRTEQIKQINCLYPLIEGQGKVVFQFGTAMVPDGPITWGQPVEFEIGVDYKVDQRLSGRYLCWRIYSQEEGSWILVGIDLDVDLAGEK